MLQLLKIKYSGLRLLRFGFLGIDMVTKVTKVTSQCNNSKLIDSLMSKNYLNKISIPHISYLRNHEAFFNPQPKVSLSEIAIVE